MDSNIPDVSMNYTIPKMDTAMKSFPEAETVLKEVKEQFNNLINALNTRNAPAWAEHYSQDNFLSAIAGTDCYASRSEWVDTITSYFEARKRQHVEPFDVHVTPLAPDLALMTSQEKTKMILQDGQEISSIHVFTLIWGKEKDGWKILHSHESWIDE